MLLKRLDTFACMKIKFIYFSRVYIILHFDFDFFNPSTYLYKMVDYNPQRCFIKFIPMILLFVSLVLLAYLVLAVVLNVLKHKNKSDSLKIAFFHPFWYFLCDIVTMEEAGKRSSGAFWMHCLTIKTIRTNYRSLFTVWLRTKTQFFKKSKFLFFLFSEQIRPRLNRLQRQYSNYICTW
jgi:hypothetical protein